MVGVGEQPPHERCLRMERLALAYFSPTFGTKRLLACAAAGVSPGDDGGARIDLSLVSERQRPITLPRGYIALLGARTHGGRLPAVEPALFMNMRGNRTPAMLLVSYGGLGYGDTLAEMRGIARENGFVVVAAAAFPARHAASGAAASGRPDERDCQNAVLFGRRVREKLADGNPREPYIPGECAPREAGARAYPAPTADSACTRCDACWHVCPVEAIPPHAPHTTREEKCCACMACVMRCPVGARAVRGDAFAARTAALAKTLAGKTPEPDFFL